ncbi:sensor histidine kinase [Actinoplanes aureus]|uniref:sensor histidine kinase n=1 Tax=Actinoplanes aureus TaxID=2792083 RepID=UPI002815BEE7|nr:histidine kinase [Actinoplanes aureus]
MLLAALVGLAFAANEQLEDTWSLPTAVAGIIAAGSVLPVIVAYRWPVMAWRLAFLMMFAGVIGADPHQSWPWNSVLIVGFLLVLARLAATNESMVTVWATVLSLIPVFLFAPYANAWGAAMLVVAVAALGDIISRRRRARELTEITELEQARRAVLEERARIAREMHDVVAHHMSMIAVQAETAPYRLEGLPEQAKQELASIATAARAALTDMRRLLGVLRAEQAEAEKEPQPGYAEIAGLVTTARRAGLPVTTELPELTDLPEAVGLTAYRIVQEALANAARHAPGGPVRLVARADRDQLELDIRNELTGPVRTGRTGHGLVGMRERVTLLGGELTAGPDGDGGYRITARIPRQAEAK